MSSAVRCSSRSSRSFIRHKLTPRVADWQGGRSAGLVGGMMAAAPVEHVFNVRLAGPALGAGCGVAGDGPERVGGRVGVRQPPGSVTADAGAFAFGIAFAPVTSAATPFDARMFGLLRFAGHDEAAMNPVKAARKPIQPVERPRRTRRRRNSRPCAPLELPVP